MCAVCVSRDDRRHGAGPLDQWLPAKLERRFKRLEVNEEEKKQGAFITDQTQHGHHIGRVRQRTTGVPRSSLP